MGCKYACMCGGLCSNCGEYEPEEYFGHAEDLSSQSRGFKNMNDEIERERQ